MERRALGSVNPVDIQDTVNPPETFPAREGALARASLELVLSTTQVVVRSGIATVRVGGVRAAAAAEAASEVRVKRGEAPEMAGWEASDTENQKGRVRVEGVRYMGVVVEVHVLGREVVSTLAVLVCQIGDTTTAGVSSVVGARTRFPSLPRRREVGRSVAALCEVQSSTPLASSKDRTPLEERHSLLSLPSVPEPEVLVDHRSLYCPAAVT